MATKKELVELNPVDLQYFKVKVVGDTPLIMHAWSAKAKREILEKELGITKPKKREPKNPIEDFASSMYWLTKMPDEMDKKHVRAALNSGDARFGFPVTAFKEAAVSAAYRNGISKDKVSLQGVFFINADKDGYYGGDLVADFENKKIDIIPNTFMLMDMVEIHSDIPVMREDLVKVGMGSPDLRYRGQFNNWWVELTIGYNTSAGKDVNYIVNLINLGGFSCGIGEWRMEKGGSYGRYHVETIG